MTRLKQAYWKAVIWVAFRMLEAAGAKMRPPRNVYEFFDTRDRLLTMQVKQWIADAGGQTLQAWRQMQQRDRGRL